MTKQFSNYSDLLTFTRASKGHALRPVSYGSELVDNSDFATDSAWNKGTGWSISGGTANYDGTGGTSAIDQNSTTDYKLGSVYQLSLEVISNQGFGANTIYVSTTQVVNTAHLDVGTHVFTFIPTSTDAHIYIYGRSGESFSIDNVSVKEVTFDESDGTLTLFEHPDNVPRVEWDADRNRLGLLIEEARTNLLKYSEDQTAVNWGNINVQNQTSPSATGPDGAQTATEIIANDQSGNPLGDDYQAYVPYASITTTANTDYTISVFVKRSSGANAPNYLYINHDVGINGGVWFDLVNGTVATERTGFTGAIEDKGNGWYRCACSFDSGSDTFMQANFFFTENDASQLMSCLGQSLGFLYGAQFEEGSFATSYIKTTGSTATRSADIADINTADFGYNLAEGTVVCEFNIKYDNGGSGFPRVWEIGNNASSADRINTYIAESTGNLAVGINTNTTAQAGSTLKTSTGGSVDSTVAMGWARDDFGVSDDGDTALTDSDIDILPTAFSRNRLKIGGAANTASDNINGHIKSIKYYPRKLTNAQLEDLSS